MVSAWICGNKWKNFLACVLLQYEHLGLKVTSLRSRLIKVSLPSRTKMAMMQLIAQLFLVQLCMLCLNQLPKIFMTTHNIWSKLPWCMSASLVPEIIVPNKWKCWLVLVLIVTRTNPATQQTCQSTFYIHSLVSVAWPNWRERLLSQANWFGKLPHGIFLSSLGPKMTIPLVFLGLGWRWILKLPPGSFCHAVPQSVNILMVVGAWVVIHRVASFCNTQKCQYQVGTCLGNMLTKLAHVSDAWSAPDFWRLGGPS